MCNLKKNNLEKNIKQMKNIDNIMAKIRRCYTQRIPKARVKLQKLSNIYMR